MDAPNSHQILSFLALFLLFFLCSTSPTKAAPQQVVENICKETISYAKCIEALGSDPRTNKLAENLKALAKISLDLAINNAKDSLALIKKLLKKKNVSRNTGLALIQCNASYQGAIASFKSARTELHEDAMTANYDVKTVVDNADSCDNEMVSRKVRIPLISLGNDQLRLYSSIGYVITNKL
ncbi:Pectinesterase inhibitor domain containing protein [Parasponia andersonii]|uniref:Pectinesterase inhibitor domain containing protein n=1 Tax=Parasponia andersonii TaxID=3476 RepID=A0A2P5BV17_PARAD|nr:Pectinesterase inhibitor domain containing protein [Parasponia andersonii]